MLGTHWSEEVSLFYLTSLEVAEQEHSLTEPM